MYCAEEAAELIDQMRRGVSVPSMKPKQCIDILHRVMGNQKLHLEAAESYVKAGWKAHIDDSGRDVLICREARATWEGKGMREKSTPQSRRSDVKSAQTGSGGLLRTFTA